MSTPISKVIILGSGFHKAMGIGADSPLGSWHALLSAVAKKAGISQGCSHELGPTLAWEQMVADYVERDSTCSSNKAEKELRKVVKCILEEAVDQSLPSYSKNPLFKQISNALESAPCHILSLNFDPMLIRLFGAKKLPLNLLPEIKPQKLRDKDIRNLYHRFSLKLGNNYSTLWFPHGTTEVSDSIRLGFRDYGLMPSVYLKAFQYFKRWERACCPDRQTSSLQPLLMALKQLDLDHHLAQPSRLAHHDNWFTRLLLLPVEIIGAAVSKEELGLQWALLQRQRNFARKRLKPQKSILYSLQEMSEEHLLFDKHFGSSDQLWDRVFSTD